MCYNYVFLNASLIVNCASSIINIFNYWLIFFFICYWIEQFLKISLNQIELSNYKIFSNRNCSAFTLFLIGGINVNGMWIYSTKVKVDDILYFQNALHSNKILHRWITRYWKGIQVFDWPTARPSPVYNSIFTLVL